MTTIAYRDGIMAADSRAYSGNRFPVGEKTKIRLLDDGTLIGVSSTVPGEGEAVIQWFAAGADPKDGPSASPKHTLLAVRPGGEVFFADDSYFISGPLKAEFFAIGSGGEYAQGAMAMGASAEQAVRIACRLDPWSAEPVMVLELPHLSCCALHNEPAYPASPCDCR